ELQPSSVVLELVEHLARGYLNEAELAHVWNPKSRAPLRRFDDVERLFPAPLARRARTGAGVGRAVGAHAPSGRGLEDVADPRRVLPAATFAAVVPRLGLHSPHAQGLSPARRGRSLPQAAGRERSASRLVVPLAAIRQFLEDPLQGSAR